MTILPLGNRIFKVLHAFSVFKIFNNLRNIYLNIDIPTQNDLLIIIFLYIMYNLYQNLIILIKGVC